MSRPSLVKSHISTYSQISSKDPDTVMSQNPYGPTTPSSKKSYRQLGYDPNTPNGTDSSTHEFRVSFTCKSRFSAEHFRWWSFNGCHSSSRHRTNIPIQETVNESI
ncbi:hypothetical protein KCU91_g44, partial [Aureobasidium melanogenum]